ncbi:MAG TPA: sulfotransferase, partial [Nitrospiria bacterium]|nr:sulfotransferase [Nitrospiria bacterium]
MVEEKTDQQLVFIVGRGRSGTSLLSSILNTHPDIAVVPEGMFVISLHQKYGGKNRWDEKSLDRFYDDLFLDERSAQWWNLDKEAFKGDLLKLKGERTFSSLCRFVYQKEAYAG